MRLGCWEDYAGGILILTYYDSADARLTQATLTVTRCLYGVRSRDYCCSYWLFSISTSSDNAIVIVAFDGLGFRGSGFRV